MSKTRAGRPSPPTPARRAAAGRPAARRRTPPASADLAARLRSLPSSPPEDASRLFALTRAVSVPLDPQQVAEAIVSECARRLPGVGWALLVDEWVDVPRCLAVRGIRDAVRVAIQALAARVTRRGADALTANLADEFAGAPAGAAVGLALPVRGQSRLALVAYHRTPVRGAFTLPAGVRRRLTQWLDVALLTLDTQLRRERAEALSVTDDLTQLYNARFLGLVLRREVKRTIRTQQPLSLLFLDLDGFKAVNDAHGHLAGSRALAEVAQVLQESARETDTVARYGGDEFAVVLPETDREGARHVAERLRERVARHVFLASEGLDVRLTVSIGIALLPGSATTADGLVQAADQAMYWIKDRGKDGIHVAVDPGQAGRR